MATKREYEAEAAAIHAHLVPNMDAHTVMLYIKVRSDFYAQYNSRFDYDLFMRACIYGKEGE